MSKQTPLTTAVSLSRKVSDGNYGTAEVFLSISGITAETTEEEMDEQLEQGKVAFSKLATAVKHRVKDMRGAGLLP